MLEQNNQEYILYLCTMMKTPLCIISYTDISISKNFRQYSELNFEVPYYDNGWIQVENKTFNLFQPNYLVLLETRNNNEIIDTEYFIINQPSTKFNDGEIKKNIQCYSAESIFNNRFLTAYEDIRVLYDPDNSYNLSDNTKGGILNYMLENMRGIWSINHISSSLLGIYHSFKYPSQSYRSTIEDLESVYNCVFKFNTVNNTISIYTADEIGEDTEIILSDENFIKSLTCDIKNAEACTMLRVYGKDNITISDQNPTGMPYLYDFLYLLNNGYLSTSLSSALTTYNNLVTSKEEDFAGYLSLLSTLRATLLTRQNELADLNTTMKTIEDSLDLLISNNRRNTTSYNTIYNNKLAVKSQITTKKGQISTVEGQINTVLSNIRSLNTSLSLESNFTSEQLIELSYYISEGSPLKLDSVDNSALLYKYAKQYMKIKSTPPFDFTIDLVDLFSISNDYIEDRYSKIKVGNFIYIDCPKLGFNCDRYRITQISHNKLNNSLSITISNKDKINTALYYLDKILKEIPREVDSLKVNKEDYSKYVEESNRILYDNSLIDLETNEIKISNENFINRRGFLGNSLGTRNGAIKIQGDQIVFSPDGDFETFYSILNPDGLYLETEDKSSRTVISSSTGIQVDVWNSVVNGWRNALYLGLQGGVPALCIDNGYISLTRIISAVETNKIYIDPAFGIKMQKTNGLGGWMDTMYLDTDGNINFTGIITGGLFRTATPPEKRIEIEGNQIRTYSSETTLQGFCTNNADDRFGDIDFYTSGLKVFSIYNTLDAGVALIQQNSKSLYIGVQDEDTYMRGNMYFTHNCTGTVLHLTQAEANAKTDWVSNQLFEITDEALPTIPHLSADATLDDVISKINTIIDSLDSSTSALPPISPNYPDFNVSNLPTAEGKSYYFVHYYDAPSLDSYICWLFDTSEGWSYSNKPGYEKLMNPNGGNIHYNGYYSYDGLNWTLSIENQIFSEEGYAWAPNYVASNLIIEDAEAKVPIRIRKYTTS